MLRADAFLFELFLDLGKCGANGPLELFRNFCGLLPKPIKRILDGLLRVFLNLLAGFLHGLLGFPLNLLP